VAAGPQEPPNAGTLSEQQIDGEQQEIERWQKLAQDELSRAKEMEVENEERHLTLQAVRNEVKMLEDENGPLRAETHAIHDRMEGSRKQTEKMLHSFQRWS
jgi:hypothetical protein